MHALRGATLLIAAAAVTVLPRVAVADPVTVTISTIGSGTLGSTSFSNETVTIQAFFTTELTGCILCDFDRTYGFSEIDGFSGLTGAATVSGLGTYTAETLIAIVAPGLLEIDDVEGHLGFRVDSPAIPATSFYTPFGPVTGSISVRGLGGDCVEEKIGFCPIRLGTFGGDLELTSAADTGTAEVEVGAASAVPEPGTLGMIVLGVVGLGGFLRQRKYVAGDVGDIGAHPDGMCV